MTEGWAVKKEPYIPFVKIGDVGDQPVAGITIGVFPTQKQAIDAARKKNEGKAAFQIVVHGRDGSIRSRDAHGLPPVRRTSDKSSLGRKAIERALSNVIRDRLFGD